MAYRLFVDSDNGVTFEPEFDFTKKSAKIEDIHRARSSKRFVYKWSEHDKWSFGIMYVNSATKSIVNSWWSSNTDLLFKSESYTAVHSVNLVNKETPIGKVIKPYDDLFKGIIQLETY